MAVFSEAENALLAIVSKVLRKERITETEVQQLRDLGWTDSDILDACTQGTNMLGMSRLFEAYTPSVAVHGKHEHSRISLAQAEKLLFEKTGHG